MTSLYDDFMIMWSHNCCETLLVYKPVNLLSKTGLGREREWSWTNKHHNFVLRIQPHFFCCTFKFAIRRTQKLILPLMVFPVIEKWLPFKTGLRSKLRHLFCHKIVTSHILIEFMSHHHQRMFISFLWKKWFTLFCVVLFLYFE
jgi:hypothetical protein